MTRLLAVAVLCVASAGCASKAPPVAKKEIDFRSELGRYGEWLVVRPYGRVWHPHAREVGSAFVPYLTGGHWRHDQKDGWEFETDQGWAYFTAHYGRWFLASDLGWVWWPDQEYATAWVDWRAGSDFVGWSPVPPPPPANATVPPEPKRWLFVKARHFTQREPTRHLLPPEALPRALELAPELGGRRGPDYEFVRAQGGLTSDGGVPDLTPPPEPTPPPQVAPAEEEKPEEPAPPPPKKKKVKRGKKGR